MKHHCRSFFLHKVILSNRDTANGERLLLTYEQLHVCDQYVETFIIFLIVTSKATFQYT